MNFKTIKNFSKYEISKNGLVVRNAAKKSIISKGASGKYRLTADSGNRCYVSKEELVKATIDKKDRGRKLSMKDVTDIRRLRAAGKKLKEIAAKYDINTSTVSEISNNILWKDK